MSLVGALRTLIRVRPIPVSSIGGLARLHNRPPHFTESPVWIQKIKDRFSALDVDKNGLISMEDLSSLANKLAAYANRGEDHVIKRYFKVLDDVYDLKGPTNEEEFLTKMKAFASKPDARERAHGIADMIFEVVDEDGNGKLSFNEFYRFHTVSVNMPDHMVKYLFSKSDTNNDGAIQNSEYRETVVSFLLSSDSAY